MNRIWRACRPGTALIVLAAGFFLAICPVINRPWAYDVNSSLGMGMVSAAVSLLLVVALYRIPNRDADRSESPRRRRILTSVIMFTVLLGLAAAIWSFYLEERLVAKRFGVVVPASIYRSGQISKHMLEPTLRAREINVVIDLNGVDPNDENQKYEIETLARRIEAHRFKLEGDGRGNVENYVQAVKTLEDGRRRGQCVLVHCSAGTQRTGGVVAVYRLLVRQEPVATVMNELRRYGWRPGKDAVLLDYLNGNMPTLARRLHEEGVIERVPEPLPVLTANAH